MRKRNRRQTRSILALDLQKAYLGGFAVHLFKPFEVAVPKDADFDIQFCREILRTDANHLEALVLLGDAYTRKGEYAKGLEMDLRLSRLKPDNKQIRYNLACSYALTGQKDQAILNLHKAIELGYRDIEHLRQDRDLDALKSDPRFQNIVKQLSADEHQAQEH